MILISAGANLQSLTWAGELVDASAVGDTLPSGECFIMDDVSAKLFRLKAHPPAS